MNDPHSNNFYEVHSSVYSIVLNKRRPYIYYFGFFSRPYSLIKGPTFIIFWNFFLRLWIFSSFMGFFFNITLHLLCASPMFTLGPLFILLDKFSRPYVYSGLWSSSLKGKQIVKGKENSNLLYAEVFYKAILLLSHL